MYILSNECRTGLSMDSWDSWDSYLGTCYVLGRWYV